MLAVRIHGLLDCRRQRGFEGEGGREGGRCEGRHVRTPARQAHCCCAVEGPEHAAAARARNPSRQPKHPPRPSPPSPTTCRLTLFAAVREHGGGAAGCGDKRRCLPKRLVQVAGQVDGGVEQAGRLADLAVGKVGDDLGDELDDLRQARRQAGRRRRGEVSCGAGSRAHSGRGQQLPQPPPSRGPPHHHTTQAPHRTTPHHDAPHRTTPRHKSPFLCCTSRDRPPRPAPPHPPPCCPGWPGTRRTGQTESRPPARPRACRTGCSPSACLRGWTRVQVGGGGCQQLPVL